MDKRIILNPEKNYNTVSYYILPLNFSELDYKVKIWFYVQLDRWKKGRTTIFL